MQGITLKLNMVILELHQRIIIVPSFDVGRTAVAYFPLQCLNECIGLVAHQRHHDLHRKVKSGNRMLYLGVFSHLYHKM